MALRLTITSYHKITPGQCPEKTLEHGVMAIGRSPDNDWVLPDPARLVSSKHCLVQNKDGRYYITDNSTNGVELVKAGINPDDITGWDASNHKGGQTNNTCITRSFVLGVRLGF